MRRCKVVSTETIFDVSITSLEREFRKLGFTFDAWFDWDDMLHLEIRKRPVVRRRRRGRKRSTR